MTDAVTPFRIAIPDADLDDLRAAIGHTRWPDQVEDAGWDYGAELGFVQELVAYWADGFDWRGREQVLNSVPQYRTEVTAPGFENFGLHFVHQPGVGPAPLPLVLAHGWPSTHFEYHDIVVRLREPGAFGDDPADAFHVVVPSLPGYGFSDIPRRRGMTRPRHGDDVCHADGRARLRALRGRRVRLGRVRDRAARPRSSRRARGHPHGHAQLPRRRSLRADRRRRRLQRTREGVAARGVGLQRDPGHEAAVARVRAHGLARCAHRVDRREVAALVRLRGRRAAAVHRDELLTTIAIYWFTGTVNSANRLYYESRHDPVRLTEGERVQPPAGFLLERVVGAPTPNIGPPPRRRADAVYDVRRWTVADRGLHFPAMENPDLYVEELRAFFRPLR